MPQYNLALLLLLTIVACTGREPSRPAPTPLAVEIENTQQRARALRLYMSRAEADTSSTRYYWQVQFFYAFQDTYDELVELTVPLNRKDSMATGDDAYRFTQYFTTLKDIPQDLYIGKHIDLLIDTEGVKDAFVDLLDLVFVRYTRAANYVLDDYSNADKRKLFAAFLSRKELDSAYRRTSAFMRGEYSR